MATEHMLLLVAYSIKGIRHRLFVENVNFSIFHNTMSWFIGLASVAGFILTGVLGPPILGLVGFSAAGPVAGSIAAGIQSTIGNVAAGSLFVGAQAAAMGQGVPAVGYAIGCGLVAGFAAIVNFFF